MKVLVTGGCSDIGVSLAETLLESGHSALVYDVKRSTPPSGVEFVEGDVRDFASLARAAKRCDVGIHLAVMAGDSSAEDIMSVNVLGAYGFLSAAWQANFRSSVIASSAPVHLLPSSFDDGFLLRTSDGADHVYDLTKALQEVIARDFHSHRLPVMCLRFGHIVRGGEESDLSRAHPLSEEDYCRGGWVALEDIVRACVAAVHIQPSAETFETLNLVGSKGSRERFRVADAEGRLRIKLKYDFAAYERLGSGGSAV